MLADHVAIDVPLASPVKHEIDRECAIAGVGWVDAPPTTVRCPYRFLDATMPSRHFVRARHIHRRHAFEFDHAVGRLRARSHAACREESNVRCAPVRHRVPLRTSLKSRNALSTGQTLDTRLHPTTVALSVDCAGWGQLVGSDGTIGSAASPATHCTSASKAGRAAFAFAWFAIATTT